MSNSNEIHIVKASADDREAIIELLNTANLPVADLPSPLKNFFVAKEADKIVGAIGCELYGQFGLLRSLVVQENYRGNGLAVELVSEIENEASALKLSAMYLLTETAASFFTHRRYESVERDQVPDEIKRSSEFSHVCPVSASVMKKKLN